MASATARIGVATANLFPQVALVGAIGVAGAGLGNPAGHLQAHLVVRTGGLWPLLDFGALDAEVNIAHLEAHASLVNYRKTILSAVQQVDTALDGYAAQQDRLKYLGRRDGCGAARGRSGNARYNRGLTDFLNVVDAERQFYDLQEQYAEAQVTQGEQFVELYKSLGGGWQGYQDVPAIRRPQPAIIAAFRRTLSRSAP